VVLPVCSGLEMDGVYMRRDDRGIRWQGGGGAAGRQVEAGLGDLDRPRPHAGEARHEEQARVLGRGVPAEWKDYRKIWATFVERTPG